MGHLFSPCNHISTHVTGDLGGGLTPYPRDPCYLNANEMVNMKELIFASYWDRSAPSGGNQQPWITRVILDADSKPRIEIYFRRETATYHGFDKDMKEGWVDIAL